MENLFKILQVTYDQPLFPQEYILTEALKSQDQLRPIHYSLESIQDTLDRSINSNRIFFDQ